MLLVRPPCLVRTLAILHLTLRLATVDKRLTTEIARELEHIRDELSNFPFIERAWHGLGEGEANTGNAAGGQADIVPGSAGAEVYNDILVLARRTVACTASAPGTGHLDTPRSIKLVGEPLVVQRHHRFHAAGQHDRLDGATR